MLVIQLGVGGGGDRDTQAELLTPGGIHCTFLVVS